MFLIRKVKNILRKTRLNKLRETEKMERIIVLHNTEKKRKVRKKLRRKEKKFRRPARKDLSLVPWDI